MIPAREIQAVVDAIVQAANPVRVILFGSHATGRATENSDLDLCVIESEDFGRDRSRREEMVRLYRALSRFPIPKDVLVFSEREMRESRFPVLNNILRQGQVLYER